eukprot:CAMPEP_0119303968 /NCGR_PEP_ID=MMETSP1333-20130426/5308_1 /TAXON_ID=418940 /ORGANISM="Scyphosphaera apsteinii, Strain RCC1455" /LENGTH=118 /DNA_ID=CAMNT_0007306757 /DNA_START=43 /DNA_END=396 /DNA_ORIENTATION=-
MSCACRATLLLGAVMQASPESHAEAEDRVAFDMHEAWCALMGHEEHGPCMKHRVMQELRDADDSQIGERMALIDEQVSQERGEAQSWEMHDWWCGGKEASEAVAGSALRRYCDGWAEH